MRVLTSISFSAVIPSGCLAQEKLPPSPVDEVGVYFKQNGHWVEMMPEVVNWKTGGVMKSISTAGIVKGDVNGRINRATSRTELAAPTELLVYCSEGVEITEYQLIRMHTHSNAREFRTVTGGVFDVSGGAKRDTIDFESEHIAQRTYIVRLPNLPAGEYGLLAPGASMANSASAQLGKMYTFSIGDSPQTATLSANTDRPMWKQIACCVF
jgi:hypothetical protein